MKRNISLKNELVSILDSAKFVRNEYVAERLNEHGHKCTYRFREGDKEFLLKRAAQIQKKPSMKFKDWQNGNKTQKVVLFLKENKNTLQTLYDINYLMKTHGYDVQKASGILFNDEEKLPPNFRREVIEDWHTRNFKYFVCIYDYSQYSDYSLYTVEYLIYSILPVLPKSYLKGIENSCLTHESKLVAI